MAKKIENIFKTSPHGAPDTIELEREVTIPKFSKPVENYYKGMSKPAEGSTTP